MIKFYYNQSSKERPFFIKNHDNKQALEGFVLATGTV
jgi:hypothetical protein